MVDRVGNVVRWFLVLLSGLLSVVGFFVSGGCLASERVWCLGVGSVLR